MTTLIITFVILILAVTGLSLGVFFSKKQISGKCSTTGEDCSCSSEEKAECENLSQ